jgi:virulence factor Mce-like protein
MTGRRIAAVIALMAVVAVAVVLMGGSDDDGYVVRAELANADGLRTDGSVKIAGITGGTITDVDVTSRDTVLVTMKLDDTAGRIGRGASLTVRPTDLLGERYADLNPGDRKHPEPSGSRIPLSRTGSSTDLDELLDMLDADTRTRLGILVNELGIGLTGEGGRLGELLRRMPVSLDQGRRLLAGVVAENVRLKRLIEQGDRVAASVAGRRDQLGALVGSASAALRAVADARRELSATIAQAPGGLAALRDTLGRLRTASVSLRPAADQLSHVAQPLTATLRALKPFAASASPTLQEARRVAPSLRRLGDGATPHVRRLAPTAGRLRRVLEEAVPSLDEIDRRAMKDLLWFTQNWSLALRGRDSLGHFLGANFMVSSEQLQALLDSYLGGGPKSPGAVSKRAHRSPSPATKPVSKPAPIRVPVPRVKVPPAKEVVSKVTDTVTGITKKLLPKLGSGAASGSTSQQEPSTRDITLLLDYLLMP